MKRQSVVIAMVVGASLLTSEAMFAAPTAVRTPMHAMYRTERLVKFSLHNASNAPIKVTAGDTELTLEPGKIVPVKLAVGAKIVAETASAHTPSGTVFVVVIPELNNSTVTLN